MHCILLVVLTLSLFSISASATTPCQTQAGSQSQTHNVEGRMIIKYGDLGCGGVYAFGWGNLRSSIEEIKNVTSRILAQQCGGDFTISEEKGFTEFDWGTRPRYFVTALCGRDHNNPPKLAPISSYQVGVAGANQVFVNPPIDAVIGQAQQTALSMPSNSTASRAPNDQPQQSTLDASAEIVVALAQSIAGSIAQSNPTQSYQNDGKPGMVTQSAPSQKQTPFYGSLDSCLTLRPVTIPKNCTTCSQTEACNRCNEKLEVSARTMDRNGRYSGIMASVPPGKCHALNDWVTQSPVEAHLCRLNDGFDWKTGMCRK